MNYFTMTTPEARHAARVLRPLVWETRAAIGNIARQGATELDKLPTAEGSPFDTLSERPHAAFAGFLRIAERVREVSALSTTSMDAAGYEGARVTKAATRYQHLQHDFRHVPSLTRPGFLAALPVPILRRGQKLELHLTKTLPKADERRMRQNLGEAACIAGITARGRASYNAYPRYAWPDSLLSDGLLGPLPSFPSDSFTTPIEVREEYRAYHTGSIAVAQLVADSLAAGYGIQLNTERFDSLLEDWQSSPPGYPLAESA